MQRKKRILNKINYKKLNTKRDNLNNFLEIMQPLESFFDVDATEYILSLRKKIRIK